MENNCEFFLWILFQMFIFLAVFYWCFARESGRKIKELQEKVDKTEARTDKLYEMFIDLIKEGRK